MQSYIGRTKQVGDQKSSSGKLVVPHTENRICPERTPCSCIQKEARKQPKPKENFHHQLFSHSSPTMLFIISTSQQYPLMPIRSSHHQPWTSNPITLSINLLFDLQTTSPPLQQRYLYLAYFKIYHRHQTHRQATITHYPAFMIYNKQFHFIYFFLGKCDLQQTFLAITNQIPKVYTL